ncbi:type II toxin-antitoxin system PemK/MazF family toxin [Azospirillum sp. RWY-5-1]|uniref:Type II toxin-antitoxin system PemK/MazF family toxin n=1 Tax=Azospirillum oleiclasticum TaxID=2735135 RepID=A0ABX2TDW5_9PROT|nr:type II toxin-antitoxin system PemK/MazF family toxin [Azospirillum oleiclasticum]NYZ14654.1 type II toxin-antitoxin system PemK/MazF family toxin [Azospirillum oleiclasticum]NYZ22359.1 type II toxin-antitoxin system PemK/MazF family toxin [Azospirillum oleiclasticum]
MPTFEVWDIVKVPFPYADRPVRQRRPALVVTADDVQANHSLIWVLMITSADNRGWPDDVAVSDHEAAGLPVPSVVRTAKIAVIDSRDAERLGALSTSDRIDVATCLGRHMATVLRCPLDPRSH